MIQGHVVDRESRVFAVVLKFGIYGKNSDNKYLVFKLYVSSKDYSWNN